jgi:hypothetical protein
MRLIVLLSWGVACTGGTPDSDAADTDGGDSAESDSIVPEEYKFLWNTEGSCSTEFGAGHQMYMLFTGRLEADGTLTGTERVWWFYADKGPEADCVDTFELSGSLVTGEPESLGCASCEHFYTVRRNRTDDQCGERYSSIYRTDDEGLWQTVMLDTLNEFNDQPNEDNRVGVFHEEKQWGGQNYVTKLYAAETGSELVPDGSSHLPPAGLLWHGKRCQMKFGGGGGGS